MGRRRFDLVVTDLDNTLYDWLGFYIPCFSAMVEEINRISRVPVADLEAAFQRVHRRHGTTEYAFAIEELDVLDGVDPLLTPAERLEKYRDAVRIFRKCRRDRLTLYPNVEETLRRLRELAIPLVALSDSSITTVSRRLRQLGVDEMFAAVSGTADAGIPEYLPESVARAAPRNDTDARCELIALPAGVRKPSVEAVRPIFDRFKVAAHRTLYVGDSLSRDVALANASGMFAAWARYGQVSDRGYLDLLGRITYWTEEDIAAERQLVQHTPPRPDVVLRDFSEVVALCGSGPP